ncbi:hypothetical protein Pyn_35124 [Prunus yedoensis var. nudiflora]|uniref:Uncharacterized protein n=1 Tax=Prunus yedoensis var. nudiflora TaxID=2094558 RepID=A0A314ZRB1_PRUYE|nr:hypothetical protein Pyn_35124 [Prunus yedoensis var. nudiflora]
MEPYGQIRTLNHFHCLVRSWIRIRTRQGFRVSDGAKRTVRSLVPASTMKMTTIQNVAMSRGSGSVSDYGHTFN